MTTLLHPTLIDPATGEPLEAIGIRANGAPIWPMIGGSDDQIGFGTKVPEVPEDDDDEDQGGDDKDDEAESSDDEEEKPKSKSRKPADQSEDEESDEEDDEDDLDAPMDKRSARKLRREAQNLRRKLKEAESMTKEEREELEKLRDEKRTEKEKLEARAKRGEESAGELRQQLEETKLRLALGLPEPDEDDESEDDDPFEDIPLKGKTYEERLANAKKFAQKYGLGRYKKAADEDEAPSRRQRKTPDSTKLRGQRPGDDDPEDDPVALANRVLRKQSFGLHS